MFPDRQITIFPNLWKKSGYVLNGVTASNLTTRFDDDFESFFEPVNQFEVFKDWFNSITDYVYDESDSSSGGCGITCSIGRNADHLYSATSRTVSNLGRDIYHTVWDVT